MKLVSNKMNLFVAFLYTLLGIIDMTASWIAVHSGVSEANPIMKWALNSDIFIHLKFIWTLLLSLFFLFSYNKSKAIRIIAWGAIILMLIVDSYHIYGLALLVGMKNI